MTQRRVATLYVCCVLLLPCTIWGADSSRSKWAMISYGDVLQAGPELSSRQAVEKAFRILHDRGFTTICWRLFAEGHPPDSYIWYSSEQQVEEYFRAKKDSENTSYAWDPHEIRWPVEVAHRLGLKFYAWV